MGAYDWAVEAYRGGDPGQEQGADCVFVAYDLETTGLYPDKDRIVEIGAVKFDRRGIIGRYSVLVDPGIPMPAATTAVNGITDDMLRGKPELDRVLPDFLSFIRDAVLIAHNANFDGSFVNAALKLRWEEGKKRKKADADPAQGSLLDGLAGAVGARGAAVGGSEGADGPEAWTPPFPQLPNRVVDTLLFAKQAFPNMPKYKMQDLAAFLGIEALDAHRAEDDARVCMELFIKCAEKTIGKKAQ